MFIETNEYTDFLYIYNMMVEVGNILLQDVLFTCNAGMNIFFYAKLSNIEYDEILFREPKIIKIDGSKPI